MRNLLRWIKRKIYIVKNNLIIQKSADNHIKIDKTILGDIRLHVKGKNNIIDLSHIKLGNGAKIFISIVGDSNKLLGENISIGKSLYIVMGQNHPNFGPIKDSYLEIGSGTSIESMRYITFNSHTFCEVGRNCMFSSDITLWNTDAHPILDLQTKEIKNWVNGISIGNHCWLGEKSSVLKNSFIPDDCIIGYNTVVSGKLPKSHSIYAGNPAEFIKSGITWDPNGARRGYIENSGRSKEEWCDIDNK